MHPSVSPVTALQSFTPPRVTLLFLLEDGKIIALRGRYLDKGRSNPRRRQGYSQPKYKSTVGVSGKLFNVDILREIERGERIFLCEGEFDTLALCQRGYSAVGVLGLTMWNDDMMNVNYYFPACIKV